MSMPFSFATTSHSTAPCTKASAFIGNPNKSCHSINHSLLAPVLNKQVDNILYFQFKRTADVIPVVKRGHPRDILLLKLL